MLFDEEETRHFWILRFLYGTAGKRISVFWACLIWIVLQTGVFIGVSAVCGNLLPGPRCDVGMLEDTVQLGVLIVVPLCFLVLYRTRQQYARYAITVPNLLMPDCPEEVRDTLRATANESLVLRGKARTIVRFFFVMGILLVVFNAVSNTWPDAIYGKENRYKWDGVSHLGTYVLNRVFIAFAWGYLLPVWTSSLYMLFSGMRRTNRAILDSGYLKVSPFAQDGVGGMKTAGTAALWFGYMVLVASLMIFTPVFRKLSLHFGHYVMLVLLGPVAAFLAVAPVFSLHKGMKKKKADMLSPVASAMEDLLTRSDSLLQPPDSDPEKKERTLRSLYVTQTLYERISKMPTWPFNSALLSRLAITSMAPLLALLARLIPKFIR